MTVNAVTATCRFSSDNGAASASAPQPAVYDASLRTYSHQRPSRHTGNEVVQLAEKAGKVNEGKQSQRASLYVAEQPATRMITCTDLPR